MLHGHDLDHVDVDGGVRAADAEDGVNNDRGEGVSEVGVDLEICEEGKGG